VQEQVVEQPLQYQGNTECLHKVSEDSDVAMLDPEQYPNYACCHIILSTVRIFVIQLGDLVSTWPQGMSKQTAAMEAARKKSTQMTNEKHNKQTKDVVAALAQYLID
jgi:hypothetical protein